ncbi:MAG: hypothetical protein UR12_C0038G0005 [candidate division TM6 bacterium GW2011_GWF2_30_66]|jgi:hypothetical protein|nr:MAG: hypothetical protein UR12_C0038G0005 [candidate division TM6 bacterium GW2011_GWF2_30_66]
MKQKNNKDISILLYALLLFSFGIGWIYSKSARKLNEENNQNNKIETLADATDKTITKNPTKAPDPTKEFTKPEIETPESKKTPEETNTNNTEKEKPKTSSIAIPVAPEPPAEITYDIEKAEKDEELTVNEILIYSKELVLSKNINNLVILLKEKCPKKIILDVINEIFKRDLINQDLTRYEKLKIILALGNYYENDKQLQAQIFDILTKYKDLENGKVPLLFAAIEIKESSVIPALVDWYKKSDRPDLRDIAKLTLEYAAKNDFGPAIKKLHELGVKIDPEYATQLLWINLKSNKTNKKSILIETLKNCGASLDSQDKQTKLTPLIKAIKNKNIATVEKLIKFGANPILSSTDKSVGFPLQVARELKQLDIEMLLRSKGAKD